MNPQHDEDEHGHNIADAVPEIPAPTEPPTGNAYVGRRKAHIDGRTYQEILAGHVAGQSTSEDRKRDLGDESFAAWAERRGQARSR